MNFLLQYGLYINVDVQGYDYEPIKENNKKSKKKFLWEFVDYMKSDRYLYAPLVRRQPWLYSSNDTAIPPPKGLLNY